MKKSRRDLLKFGAMAGAGLVIPKFASGQTVNTRVHTQGGVTFHGHVQHPIGQLTTAANTLTPFVDQLPIMPVIHPNPTGVTHIRMQPALQKVHRDLSANPDLGLQRHLAGADDGSAQRRSGKDQISQ